MTRRQRSRRARAYIAKRDDLQPRPAFSAKCRDIWKELSEASTAIMHNGEGAPERPTRLNPKWPRESCDPIVFREETQ